MDGQASEFMDVEGFLLKFLPQDYGRIECNPSEVARKGIGIVIPSYGRPQYVKKCLASLKKSNLEDCILCLVDETESTARNDFHDYYCFYNIDSSGYDIKRVSGDIHEIRAAANQVTKCIAFNGSGWLKYKLKATKRLRKLEQTMFGFYVKKSYLDRYEELRTQLEALQKGLETKPDRKTVDLVEQYEIDDVPIIKIFKKYHGSMYDSIQKGVDLLYAACQCNWFMVLDSDTIVKEGWVERIKELHLMYEPHYPTITTGFNTLNHPITAIKEKHCIKTSIGGINMFFNRKIYEDVVRDSLLNNGWDFTVVEKMRALNGIMVSTTPSVVQHIGHSGIWSHEGRFDTAIDYESHP